MFDEIKTTAHNVLHCNENARKLKNAEEATKRVAIAGGVSTITVGIVGFLTKMAWKKKYMSMEHRISELENSLSAIQQKYDCAEGGENID